MTTISETLREKAAQEKPDPCFANEAAFPIPDVYRKDFHPGLTKREYFAALALQGLMATTGDFRVEDLTESAPSFAQSAVEIANALIQRLNKNGDSD